MFRHALPRKCLPLLFGLFCFCGYLNGQEHDLNRHPELSTTDDPRRIPIPTRDLSGEPVLVLEGGTLIDGSGAQPVVDSVVVIQGDRILDVGPRSDVTLPAMVDRTIDVSGLFVIPGLIDLHMHFTQQRGEDFGRYRDSDAAAAIRGVKLLGQFLDGGITAVRDVGTSNDVALKVKEAVARRIFDGPRVFWSGQLIASRGGHGDETISMATGRPRSLQPSSRVRVAGGPWDWRLAVREQIRNQADLIKLTAPYTREEVTAAVDEAHMHGYRVAVDSFGKYSEWAVEAGVDTIEHPLDMSDRLIRMMKESGTGFVPTMTAFYNPLTYGYPSAGIPAGGFYYTLSRRFFMTHESNMESLRKAHQAGVKIGIGTDIPFENEKRYPGDYFVELNFFKEAGYSNQEILEASTRIGAELLGLADILGTLEKGKLADILVVSGNPLESHENLQNLKLLVADGRVVRNRMEP